MVLPYSRKLLRPRGIPCWSCKGRILGSRNHGGLVEPQPADANGEWRPGGRVGSRKVGKFEGEWGDDERKANIKQRRRERLGRGGLMWMATVEGKRRMMMEIDEDDRRSL